jgi:alkylation response protein AidB-like acyl-CoA dehydrogenase
MDAEAYDLETYRTVSRLLAGGEDRPRGSLNKIFWSEMDVRMHETALRLLGPRADLLPEAPMRRDGPWLDGSCSRCPGRSTPAPTRSSATSSPSGSSACRVVVPVLPHDPYPAHASSADLFLVAADAATVVAAEPDAVAITPQPNLDGARPTAHVRLRDPAAAPALAGPAATAAIRTAEARGAMGAAAQLVGVGHAAIDLAVAYAKQREQFGVAIGTFQAVKHHLATALVDVAFARPLVERAAHSLATGDPDAAPHAAMAKAFASEAAEAAVEHALQVHGAIGYTWECDLHLWLKRAYSLSAAFGDVETQWQAVEAHLLA